MPTDIVGIAIASLITFALIVGAFTLAFWCAVGLFDMMLNLLFGPKE